MLLLFIRPCLYCSPHFQQLVIVSFKCWQKNSSNCCHASTSFHIERRHLLLLRSLKHMTSFLLVSCCDRIKSYVLSSLRQEFYKLTKLHFKFCLFIQFMRHLDLNLCQISWRRVHCPLDHHHNKDPINQ